jgi:Thiol:disulfide interchange protein DsbD, N-terminal
MLTSVAKIGAVELLSCAALLGQLSPGHKVPSVTMSPAPLVEVRRGGVASADLRFRIGEGFHVNSNHPTEEYLIPTELKLDAPTDIIIAGITYPPGQMKSFPFAPKEKLSVYTGEFLVSVVVRPLDSVLPTEYAVHGTLKYQACDNAACYPPKRLPVDFTVKVVKGPRPHRRNPAQSPHVHN